MKKRFIASMLTAVMAAQMNPHFFYNTLDSLYWKAMESENDEIQMEYTLSVVSVG